MPRRPRPGMVPRARHPVARLGPVWAILAISVVAAFLPTSVSAQTENEPGRLDVVVGGAKCVEAPRGNQAGLGLFPERSTAMAAKFENSFTPRAVAVDPSGRRLFIAAGKPGMIGTDKMVSDLAPPTAADGTEPLDGSGAANVIAFDPSSNRVFYGGLANNRVMMVPVGSSGPTGPPTLVTGTPLGSTGGPGSLDGPTALAFGGGNVYFAERGAVSRINPSQPGAPSRKVAGGGTAVPAVGLPATDTSLDTEYGPFGLAVAGGSLFIADGGFSRTTGRVVIVDLASGIITGVVTNMISKPFAVAVDDEGDHLYVADSNKVLLFDTNGSYQKSVAGTGSEGALAGHTWAKTSPLSVPSGLALDGAGNLYIGFNVGCAIARVVRPADAGDSPVTTAAPTSAPTSAPTTPTSLPTANPPGNTATGPSPGASLDSQVGGSGDLGGAGSGDPRMGGTTGSFDGSGGGGGGGGGGFNSNIVNSDFFNNFNVFGARGDVAGTGAPGAGLDGGGGGGGGAGISPAPTPPAPAPPPQPVASGPPLAGQGVTGPQVGPGATTGQLPRGAVRYTMVARVDEGIPMAATAVATGAVMAFGCVLVLAAGPGRAGAPTGTRSRPRPRIAY